MLVAKGKPRIWLITSALLMLSTNARAEAEQTETLSINPTQCVALTQGQNCYVDINLSWSSSEPGNYCLYSSQQSKPLQCWQQVKKGEILREFVASKNIVFSLSTPNNKDIKATQQLKVTWVHQKRGQPRMWWRIF